MGTCSADIDGLKKYPDDERKEIIEGEKKLRDTLEQDGFADRYEQKQGPKPDVDDTLIVVHVEQL